MSYIKSYGYWYPTPYKVIKWGLDWVGLSKKDSFWDLGAGDGKVLVQARSYGAKCIGVEKDENFIYHFKKRRKSIKKDIELIHGDILDQNLSKATVVFLSLQKLGYKEISDKLKIKNDVSIICINGKLDGYELQKKKKIVDSYGKNWFINIQKTKS